MNHTPTPSQLAAIHAAIPDLEAVLLQAPQYNEETQTERWLATEESFAKEIALPAIVRHEALYHELLTAEVAATPESDALRREYFDSMNVPDMGSLSFLNAAPFVRMLLATCYAFTGRTSDLVQGDEMTPCAPPPPPPASA